MAIDKDYLNILKERIKNSRVHKKFQFTGLLLAEILNDEKHKSLYIKLAKKYNEQKLISLAKNISERKNVKNRGAYFMVLIQNSKISAKGGSASGGKNKNV